MKVTNEILDFIKSKEGLKLNAYICPANVWTIGYGNTFYEDGSKVKQGDKVTKERADELFINKINEFAKGVKSLLEYELNENQFSALVSFSYNVGLGNFKNSTLLKIVNSDLRNSEVDIRREFYKWNKGGGKILKGLVIRRKIEADIYFK
jgi:lysozyme